MTFESFLALATAMIVMAIIPGPAVFSITSSSLVGGFKRGVYMTAGLILADYVFILLAISGLAIVAEVMGAAFVIIKYLCAAYLVWMGWSLFTAKASEPNFEQTEQKKGSAIITGFVLLFSNPKAIIFYAAFFPAFVDIQNVTTLDVLGIMLCATLAFGSVNLGYAYLAAKASKLVSTTKRMNIMQKSAGAVMAITGLSIVLRS